MANFHTHLSVALAISTALATTGFMLNAYGFFEMIVLACAGMVGGLLPDIDLDHAKISRIGFNLASLLGAMFMVILYHRQHPTTPTDGLIAWGVGFLLLRFGFFALFSRLTHHRGMVHSVPYMATLSLMFVYLAFYIFDWTALLSWFFGLFIFIGTMVHLLLDELFSVNIYGLRVKKSFGSAFKFFERKKPLAYMILYGVLFGLWSFAPPTEHFF